MPVRDLLERFLSVPRFIARPAAYAAAWHFVFVGAVTVIKSGTNALFLARADPSQLPLLYVAVAVVVGVSTSLLARLLARRSPARVLTIGIVGGALAVAGSTLAAAVGVPGGAAAAYVVGEAAATSGSVLFWARVAEAFQARDQKKVVGLVGAGGMLGAALGGLGMRLVAESVGVVAPMLLAAALWVATLPLLRALRARGGARGGKEQAELLPALRYLGARGYPMAVASLVVLLAALGAGTDFVFRTAVAQSHTEAEMAGLFGLLNTVVGVIVVAFQISLTGRLLGRIGVFAFIALVPVGLVLTSAAALVLPGAFAVVLVMKGIEMAGAYSLHQTGVALLYNPMPPEIRSQVRTLIDGAIKKSGAAAAGLVLGGLAAFAPFLVGPWVVALTAGAVLLLLPLLRARYLESLDEKLANKKTRPRQGTIDPSDKVTREALRQALMAHDAERVLASLSALGAGYELEPKELLTLVEHADERVRTQALAHAPSMADDVLVRRLLAIAHAAGPRRPRTEAVRALARMKRADAGDLLEQFLDEDEPGVVAAAIEGILRGGEHARARARLEHILEDLSSRGPAWRREMARLIGAVDETRYDRVLATLIDDTDPTVRALAIDAAGRERHSAHIPLLVQHLGDRVVRARAMSALVLYRDEAVEALSLALDDRTRPVAQRVAIPRLLAQIGTAAAARALLFSNTRDDAYLQGRIAQALVQIVERDPSIAVDQRRTDEAIGRRLGAFSAYDDARVDLDVDASPALTLLKRLVRERQQGNLRIALDLLGIHRGLARMQTVFAGLVGTSPAARHDALELFDAHLQGDPLRAEFLSLLERHVGSRPPEAARLRVVGLCGSRDPLIRGVARRTALILGIPLEEGVLQGVDAVELEGEDMKDDLVERLFLLEHVDLFEGLATDDLAAIAHIASEQLVPPGAFLYREGETSTQMYVIVEGDVELTRGGGHLMRLRAGESAGQVSFLDRGPRPVTARVGASSARLLVIEREAFMDLMADRPGLMHAFFGVLAQRLRVLIEREDPQMKRVSTSV